MAWFWGLVIAIKVVGKTSLKDFVLGVGGKLNKKECLTVLALSVSAFLGNLLTDLGHLHLRGVSFGTFAAGFLISLALIWMQTTWEELLFRGIILHWVSKNDIGFNKKSILAAGDHIQSQCLYLVAGCLCDQAPLPGIYPLGYLEKEKDSCRQLSCSLNFTEERTRCKTRPFSYIGQG